ncbi:TetR family transcriptional regulator [Actinoplanes sp. OR16]|uniref:TetR/AcrR family transcriptional regulator n=1 Tax=Actinoplanes sp. OR16 TaxID=946334 RepID=UPI000F6E40B2|nr:TetR/AcrR family transcriptional regulator [Actinoplanes sp. OR16]BBH64070.1 TetR family transcriptional regulator [Actinoplanes sp. OR16]
MSILVGMVRLTRVQQQARTRSVVLAAAADEFREHGFADAKIDRIAARADLTRGAVYSNFPSKRALYLAVLLDAMPAPFQDLQNAPEDAAAEFARAWLDRLPLAGDSPADGRLRSQSLASVFEDEPGRTALTGIAHLEALLLATVLDHSVRRTALLLTMLHGARELARSAPGFGDPFDVVAACRHLAAMDVPGGWDPPYLPFVAPAAQVRAPWTPPEGLTDALTGRPADLTGDGLVTVLGSARLTAAEEAVRSRERATIAVVTADPAETGALIRLRIAELTGCLPKATFPFQLVFDERGMIAAAVEAEVDDSTQMAVRISGGRIVARASGRGAAYAVTREDR